MCLVLIGEVPTEVAQVYNDLFRRRQEGDYTDFVRFEKPQVLPWIPKAEEFVNFIASIIAKAEE